MAAKNGNVIQISIDAAVYPLEAIQAAAYTFTDRAYVRIVRKMKNTTVVSFKPKGPGSAVLSDEFHNELLHEALRLRVSQSNQKIREYIVTKALVSSQVPSAMPPASGGEESCPACESQSKAQPTPVDAGLEKEIEDLLSKIEKSGSKKDDPLGITIPWEKKYKAQPKSMRAEKAKRG